MKHMPKPDPLEWVIEVRPDSVLATATGHNGNLFVLLESAEPDTMSLLQVLPAEQDTEGHHGGLNVSGFDPAALKELAETLRTFSLGGLVTEPPSEVPA